ncbi:MAG: ATP-binding protein [Cyclobacteriaceae bacterium]
MITNKQLTPKALVMALAAMTLLISGMVMIGWLTDLRLVLSVIPEGATMKFNTALLLFLLGVGLLTTIFNLKQGRLIRKAIAVFVFAMGLATLLQDFFSSSAFLDLLFVDDPYSIGKSGRMSPATAVCFMLLAVGLVGVNAPQVSVRRNAQHVLLIVIFISFLVVVAYILQIPKESKVFLLSSMAIHTSVLCMLLAVGLSLKNRTLGFMGLLTGKHAGSKLIQMLLPFNIALPLVLSYVLLNLNHSNQIDHDFGIAVHTVIFTLTSIAYISIISIGLNKSDVQRKELEGSLKSTNQELTYFKQALDETAIVAITDSNDVINYVNDKFCKTSKFGRSELIGQTHQIVNSGYHPKEFFVDMWETISNGDAWVGEIRNKAKDGSYYWVLTSIVPFKNDVGDIYQYLSIRQDITKRKEVEGLLSSQYIPTLERKNKELEHFVFIASHDLQEPLHTLRGIVDLLEKEYKGQLDETADEYLGYISGATRRMSDLIKGLLDYSRIGGKKLLEEVDCNEILRAIGEDLAAHIESTNTTLIVEDLPHIKAYRTELRLLFQNLINNAIKFRQKGIDPEVHISVERDDGHWKFAVRDNGIGIEEDHKHKIFAIFKRLHSRSEYEGTGIGLSHCQKIVHLFGGGIWVDSKPMQGSTFYFTIPINIK